MGGSCKCTPTVRVHPCRRGGVTFYWADEGAAFNLEGLGVSKTITVRVSISGNNTVHTSKNPGYAYVYVYCQSVT